MAKDDRGHLEPEYKKRKPGEHARAGDYVFNGHRYALIRKGDAWEGAEIQPGFERYATVWTRPPVEFQNQEVVWNPAYMTGGRIDWDKVFPGREL